ncbi:MAG: glycoside hydrolase family 43 protein [Bacteroidales bacterium]|nr:glycoside hydrolase family 43 protein [Candidatus Cryptobacteroides caccocaballi]
MYVWDAHLVRSLSRITRQKPLRTSFRFNGYDLSTVPNGHPNVFCANLAKKFRLFIITSPGQYFYFFHSRFKGHGDKFQVRVHEMFMNEDGWPVVAPHRYSGDLNVQLSKKDVTGEYKFVNHGTRITADITESVIISLNIDGKTYKGVFHYQYDHANNVNRVTFTACGLSNETIWGSKCEH